MIRQAFEKESVSHTWVFEWKRPNSSRPKRMRQVKRKFRSMLIIVFDIKEFFTKNSSWQARLSIIYKEFEVCTVVTMKNAVFWDVMPCGSRTDFSEERSTTASAATACYILTMHRFLPGNYLPKTT
jgi:hypothetical protein